MILDEVLASWFAGKKKIKVIILFGFLAVIYESVTSLISVCPEIHLRSH